MIPFETLHRVFSPFIYQRIEEVRGQLGLSISDTYEDVVSAAIEHGKRVDDSLRWYVDLYTSFMRGKVFMLSWFHDMAELNNKLIQDLEQAIGMEFKV